MISSSTRCATSRTPRIPPSNNRSRWSAELKPKRAWFTHICHDLGHVEANAKLPEHVRLSYDGLQFEVEL